MSWFTTAPEIAFVPVSTKPIDEKVVNLEKTLEGVDAEILPRIEKKILEIKEHLTSDPAGWEFLLESQGVRGIRKYVDERPIAVIRSEIVMPFHILDIFEFFNNTTNACSLDPAINTIEVFKRISPHNWISRVMLHGQWPVLSPREFINFFHWRLMEDGSILYLDFSVRMDDAFPEVEDPVRGWDNVNGYLFRPTADGKGTDVHMIFDSSPNGDLPTMIVNQAMVNQPTTLTIARDALQKLAEAGKTRPLSLPASYDEFVFAVAKNARN